MTEKLKEKIKWKHKIYRDYLKNGKTEADYSRTVIVNYRTKLLTTLQLDLLQLSLTIMIFLKLSDL